MTSYFQKLERSLEKLAAIDNFNVAELREINRNEPRLLQLFVLGPQGQLNYPDPATELNDNERLFLIQAAKMFTGQDLKSAVMQTEQGRDLAPSLSQNRVATTEPVQIIAENSRQGRRASPAITLPDPDADSAFTQQAATPELDLQVEQQMVQEAYQSIPVQNLEMFAESSGWFVWYWDRGLNLIYWQRRPTGHIIGFALERARWMADLVAQLPETVVATTSGKLGRPSGIDTRVRLVNSSANSVYQWGVYEPPAAARPLCEIPLAEPLASWRLQCFVPIEQLTGGTDRSVHLSLLAGVLGIAVALSLIAWFFVREYARDMQQAAQQVSFVNQVSHELKTPLTNIRMYAELLERDLDDAEVSADTSSADMSKPRQRLNIILSEGQRLSRLIGNVLTFARQRRNTLQLQPQNVSPADLIVQIVDRFRPALTDQQIDIEVHGPPDTSLKIDPDFLEQILGNLISNVEKYAAAGGLLQIESSVRNGVLQVDVVDAGPGIVASQRKRIFEPFARVSNQLSYAAGTGIGLTIARELARLHGGDVCLMDSDSGCRFRVTLADQSNITEKPDV